MKSEYVFFILTFLLLEAACKKNREAIVCPEVISPVNCSTFHSGDTISILIYLPPPIQNDFNDIDVSAVNVYYDGNDTANLDTIMYPMFSADHYGTVKLILKAARNGVDTNYIGTGFWGPGTLDCRGITIYIRP
jgi:hypothetical protein